MIEFQDVSLSFKTQKDSRPIFNDLNISFEEGLYSLIGPSGGGKSTMLRLIADRIRPSSGRIIRTISSEDLLLIENLPRCNLKVEDYLLLKLYPADLECAKAEIEKVFGEPSLHSLIKQRLSTLSEGQKMLLSVFSWKLFPKKVYLFDEPLAFLEPANRQRVQQELLNLAKNHLVIVTVHPQDQADQDFLDQTKIIRIGDDHV